MQLLISSFVFGLIGLVGAIVLAVEIGYRLGLRRLSNFPEVARNVSTTMEGSVFGLMGLLIAFTFYGAASRFDVRRSLMVREANAIGTAYLRVDLLPAEAQPRLREDFRKYLHSRIATYHKIPDIPAVRAELARSGAIQSDLWKDAVAGTRTSSPATQSLVLTSMNEVIDIITDQTVALTTHPPGTIYAMLVFAVLISSVLAGYTMSLSRTRDWLQIIAFTLVLSVAVYVIVDYEYPRGGIIRIDPVDQVLVDVLEQMK